MKQTVFLAGFGLVCCVFVFFVPFSSQPKEDADETLVSSGTEVLSGEEVENQIFTGILRIGVDPVFEPDSFEVLRSQFQQRYGGTLEFQALASGENQFSGYDVLLIAYDQMGTLSGGVLRFSEALDQYFLDGGAEVLASGNFIPYGVDPLAGFVQSGAVKILSELYEISKTQTGSVFFLPLFSGENFSAQNFAYAQMISDFAKYNDNGAFERWLEMYQDSLGGDFDILKEIGKVQNCQPRSALCLVEKGGVKVAFGFSSEGRKFPQLVRISYPYRYEAAPVRMYGFVLNPESENRPLAEGFLSMYLQSEVGSLKTMLDAQGMYSAFKDVFSQQCQQEQTCQSLYPVRIIKESEELSQKLLNDRLFLKVLEKKVKPDLYLQRVSL